MGIEGAYVGIWYMDVDVMWHRVLCLFGDTRLHLDPYLFWLFIVSPIVETSPTLKVQFSPLRFRFPCSLLNGHVRWS